MTPTQSRFLHFDYIPYPLWRRKNPGFVRLLSRPLLNRVYPVQADDSPPATPEAMANWLARWGLLGGGDAGFVSVQSVQRGLEESQAAIIEASDTPATYAAGRPVRVVAQWEPMEKVLISWAWHYPPLWDMHAQMAEAISAVSDVEILVTSPMWARAVWLYLAWRGNANMVRIHFLVLPTDDIWVRDYGPIVGLDADGKCVAVNPVYAPLPLYPQDKDNSMVIRWSAHHGIPVRNWDLLTEGGNLWSDGRGTLIMTEQIFYSNRYYSRDSILKSLHSVFDFEKAIIVARLPVEETGHIDLLVKLATEQTVFMSAPTLTTRAALHKARRKLERETNAAGQHYQVVELPTPPLYVNWFVYPIRRSYTNALTINGRVLVPVYGVREDEQALRTYEQTLPDFEIIPIDCKAAINGGGAVHCMTKEVPVERG